MQEGVIHSIAAERARSAGLSVVMDRCILKEHIKRFRLRAISVDAGYGRSGCPRGVLTSVMELLISFLIPALRQSFKNLTSGWVTATYAPSGATRGNRDIPGLAAQAQKSRRKSLNPQVRGMHHRDRVSKGHAIRHGSIQRPIPTSNT